MYTPEITGIFWQGNWLIVNLIISVKFNQQYYGYFKEV
jgi:hypothetical protein